MLCEVYFVVGIFCNKVAEIILKLSIVFIQSIPKWLEIRNIIF